MIIDNVSIKVVPVVYRSLSQDPSNRFALYVAYLIELSHSRLADAKQVRRVASDCACETLADERCKFRFPVLMILT